MKEAHVKFPEIKKAYKRYHEALALVQADKKSYEMDYTEDFHDYLKTRPIEALKYKGV